MAAATIDYDKLAQQQGGTPDIDYDALSAQHGGAAATAQPAPPKEGFLSSVAHQFQDSLHRQKKHRRPPMLRTH